MVKGFEGGVAVQTADSMPSERVHASRWRRDAGAAGTPRRSSAPPSRPAVAAAVEFVLEGLHLTKKLNKDMQAGQFRYRV